jgi:predicted enzyme related to lactoylglutathione lyase
MRLDISGNDEIYLLLEGRFSMSKSIINGIGHFDISGPDLTALRSFYEGVFGWQIAPQGPGYALAATAEGTPDGALVEAETAGITIGIVVADLAATLEDAVKHGGQVAMPVVDNGWVQKATLADPAGNRVTVIQA